MANTKISALTDGTTAQASDAIPVARSGANYYITPSYIKTYLGIAGTLNVASGKTFTASNTLTLAGTDSTTMTFPSTSATIARTDAGQTFTGNQVVSSGSFGLSGNISAPAWTTSGIRYKNVAATLTDTSSTGTVATAYTDLFGGNTIAASNATTFTNYYTAWISSATAGTNVTLTSKWALGLGGSLDVQAGTVTTNTTPALNLSQTWNAAGVTFKGVVLNITDTASASGSLLLDLQVGASSKFKVDKSGLTSIGAAISLDPANASMTFTSSSSTINPLVEVKNDASISTYLYSARSGLGGTISGCTILQNASDKQIFIRSTGGILSNGSFGFANTTSPTTPDVILTRAAAASLQLGAADAASPVAQTLQVQSVVAGTTNTAGTNFTIKGSAGTGTGAGGSIIFQVAPAGSSGTSQNALATALTINSSQNIIIAGSGTSSTSGTGVAAIGLGGSSGTGFISTGGGLGVLFASSTVAAFRNNEVRISSTIPFGFASAADPTANGLDVMLNRDAANTLALRNGTNAQRLNSYRSYTDAANYQRVSLAWNTSTALVMNEGAGTGADGSVAFNDAALATDATKGFIMVPSCAGTPTGTPADIPTGQIPLVWDSTNLKLYVYTGGAWKSSAAFT